jgi:hypothetical protein
MNEPHQQPSKEKIHLNMKFLFFIEHRIVNEF